jgi:hypothetical protein
MSCRWAVCFMKPETPNARPAVRWCKTPGLAFASQRIFKAEFHGGGTTCLKSYKSYRQVTTRVDRVELRLRMPGGRLGTAHLQLFAARADAERPRVGVWLRACSTT